MDPKKVLRDLIKKTTEGDFEHVYVKISSEKLELDTSSAIKIVISCCTACSNNLSTPNNISEQHLCKLLKHLLPFIRAPTNIYIENYLQSIFYILKLLYTKEKFRHVLELKELLTPEFMPAVLTSKQESVYRSICKCTYNVVVRTTNSKKTLHNDSLLELSYLLSSMYQKLQSQSELIENACNCTISLASVEVSCASLQQYYSYVLEMINKPAKNLTGTVYKSLLNYFVFVFVSLLKRQEFAAATACYNSTSLKVRKLFDGKEFVYLSDVLDICKWMIPTYQRNEVKFINNCHNSLKNVYKQFGSTASLQVVCNIVSSVAYAFVQHLKTNEPHKWLENLPADIHLLFYKFLFDIAQLMSKVSFECSCATCEVKTNLNEALKIMHYVVVLGKLYILGSDEVIKEYKVDIAKYLEKYLTYVTSLKHRCCDKWKGFWYDAGVHLYNIGFCLYKRDDEMSLTYFNTFIKHLIEFEGVESSIIGKTYLNSSLSTISDVHFKSKDYEKCLVITAFNIAISSDPCEPEVVRWIKTKAACRENDILQNSDIQELTIPSILEKHKSEVASFCPGFKLDRNRQIELLILELNQYKLKWKSKAPMMAVYRHLFQIADALTLAKVFTDTWGFGELHIHEQIPRLLHDTIIKFESKVKKGNVEENLYLAHLYYLHNKYRVEDTIIKNCDDMDKTMNVSKPSNELGGIPPDPNDECDIVSSYESLRLNRYLNVMKDLHKSLTILSSVVLRQTAAASLDTNKLYKLLKEIGHKCRLHCHVTNSLQAWELAYRLADSLNNKPLILESVGFIIELSDVNKALVKTLVSRADSIAEEIDVNLHLNKVVGYYLNKAAAYLPHDFDTAYKSFTKASKFYDKFRENYALKTRFTLLHHKFIMLPCKFNVDGHKEYSLVKIHTAYNDVIKHYTEGSCNASSYDMSLFFEVNEELAKMYHVMRLPREVRCYCKEVVLVAQRMVLPFRTVSLLYYLAHADISSCRFDDCRVKISGISDILCLSKCKTPLKSPQLTQRKIKLEQAMDNLTSEFRELMLDLPSKTHRQQSSGSPTFSVETFKFPSFFYHEEACECFYCVSLEYQHFVLKKTYLDALLNVYEGNAGVAQHFFGGGLKLYEFFKSKQVCYTKKLAKNISFDLVPVLQDAFLEIYCYVLLEYGNSLLRSGSKVDAKNVNKKLIDYLVPVKFKYVYLYNEALAQKLNILSFAFAKPTVDALNAEMENVSISDNSRTPETKQSKVSVPLTFSPENRTPPKRIVKTIRFDLSDNEEENASAVKKSPALNLPPFLNMQSKTPAPSTSKIKVYTGKAAKKKKPVLADVSPAKCQVSNDKTDFIVPVSPNAHTPNSLKAAVKIESNLLSRTKLLTERLRTSSKNLDIPTITVNDENLKRNNSSQSSGRGTVRKNILSQLESSADAGQNGAIRRSKRNKK